MTQWRHDKPFVSEMTFGQFIIGLFNPQVFPYDRHLEFVSSERGHEIGELIVGLIDRSRFTLDHSKTRSTPSFSVYVYADDPSVYEDTSDQIERVVEVKVWRRDYEHNALIRPNDALKAEVEKKFPMFFPPNCKIEIECQGYPF